MADFVPSWPVGLGSYLPSWPLYTPPVPTFSNLKSLQLVRSSNQYANLGNNIQIQPNQQITISAWIFLVSSNTGGILSSQAAGTSYGLDFGLIASGSLLLRFEMYGNSGALVAQTVDPVPTGQWLHVVQTYDGSNTTAGIKLYINGVLQSLTYGGSGITGGITYTEPTKMGRDYYYGTLDGYLDELSVWSTALTSTEITALYNNGLPADLTGLSNLIHWYRNGDGPGDTSSIIKDQVGTVDGTLVNGATAAGATPNYVPTLRSTLRIKNNPNMCTIANGLIYVPYYSSGDIDPGYDAPDLEIYSISSPTTPTLVGTLPTATDGAHNPWVAAFAPGNSRYLYVCYYKSVIFLKVIDVLDPTNPVVVGSVSYGSGPDILQSNSIAFSTDGSTAYVTGSGNVAAVIDISTPTSPSLVTTFVTNTGSGDGHWTSAGVKGNYLYIVGDGAGTFAVYDISTQHSPSLVTTISVLGGYSFTFDPTQNYIYLGVFAGLNGGLQIVDVTTPAAPVVKGSTQAGTTEAYSQAIYGNNLLLMGHDASNNLTLWSVADPNNPLILATYPVTPEGNVINEITSINVSSKYAYITSIYAPGGAGVADDYGYLQVWQVAA